MRDENNEYVRYIYMVIDDKTICLSLLEHAELEENGEPEFSGFDHLVNHSCDANMFYDEKNNQTITTRQIKKNEELTTNYNCHNYDENSNLINFPCNCDRTNCTKTIKGFKYLTVEEQQFLLQQGGVSAHCIKQYSIDNKQ